MNAIQAKGISLVIFFLITVVAGSIPIILFSQCRGRMNSRRGHTIISLLNCFAGGVFLATCVLNLLVEGFEEYEEFREVSGFDSEYPFFHLAIGVGFFAVAFVERLAIVMSRDRSKNKRRDEDPEEVQLEDASHGSYTVQVTPQKDMVGNSNPAFDSPRASGNPLEKSAQSGSVFVVTESGEPIPVQNCRDMTNDSSGLGRRRSSDEPEESTERFTGHSGVIAITIFLALSFHTIFDGLAVGLQETETNIWTITIAISIHKTIVAVSLGLELASASPSKPCRAFLFLFIFALMAPLGVAIGMGVTSSHVDERAHLLAGGVLQGVATGSFLYVTFFEVLGEELGHRSSVLKIVVTMVGFGAMAVAKIWDTD